MKKKIIGLLVGLLVAGGTIALIIFLPGIVSTGEKIVLWVKGGKEMVAGIIFVILGIISAYLLATIRIVPHQHEWIVERFGKYWKTWETGLHFLIIPGIFTIKNKLYVGDEVIKLNIGKETGEGGRSKLDFSDDSAAVDITFIIRVGNSKNATYEVDEFRNAIIEKVEAEARAVLGGSSIDDAVQKKYEALDPKKTTEKLQKDIKKWGVILKTVLLVDIDLGPESEKARRAVLLARKRKLVTVTDAEAAAIAQEKFGEGEVKKIKKIADALDLKVIQVIAYLLTSQLYTDLKDATIIATSEAGTLNLPINVAATMAALQSKMKMQEGGE